MSRFCPCVSSALRVALAASGALLAVGCVATELDVPVNHPGHPRAAPGSWQAPSALRRSAEASAEPSDEPHEHHHHGHDSAAPESEPKQHEHGPAPNEEQR